MKIYPEWKHLVLLTFSFFFRSTHSPWITHIERVCDSVHISEAVYGVRLGSISNEPDLSDIRTLVLKEREAARSTSRQAMGTPQLNPMVRYRLASVLMSCSIRSSEGRPRQNGVLFFLFARGYICSSTRATAIWRPRIRHLYPGIIPQRSKRWALGRRLRDRTQAIL